MEYPNVYVLVLSYNGKHLLPDALNSYLANDYPNFKVIVVDNASNDDSAEMVAKKFPQAILIRNDKNRGFAAANNQGVAKARGNFLIFLNDDTVICDQAFAHAVNYFF